MEEETVGTHTCVLIVSISWGILIFVLSSIPGSSLPKSPSIPHFDKMVHAGLYFILALSIMPVMTLSKKQMLIKLAPLITIIIVALYGGIIEIAQENWFTNRSGDIYDFLSDIAGGIFGIIFYFIIINKFYKPHKPFS